ncbi:EexN family lipoprotein [Campylobacter sp. VBCF_06 NA8]|uniref:EexN family lipoprotein n=1 Tax=Campylobacter sp. VBCF_06 NA8 TaxID=2983822 RepID=UPI0022E9CB90|nr:EexN family lipoprotein [Campylobacter sp. VBCF_06 NA8]MDA3045719.1 EexN family lipoprotein [Campylobacter sp. VBCF_06 NA8]
MKRILTLSLVAAVGFGLSGCGEEDPRTVEYFAANWSIAVDRVGECNKMERMSEKTAKDCANAKTAVREDMERTEREIIALKRNASKYVLDFIHYYDSHGKFVPDIQSMTKLPIPIKVDDTICVDFAIKNENELEIKSTSYCEIAFKKYIGTHEAGQLRNSKNKGKIIIK